MRIKKLEAIINKLRVHLAFHLLTQIEGVQVSSNQFEFDHCT